MATVADVTTTPDATTNQAKSRVYLCPTADTLAIGDLVPTSTGDLALKMSRQNGSIATHTAGIIPFSTPPSWSLAFGTTSGPSNTKIGEIIDAFEYPESSATSNLMKHNTIGASAWRQASIVMAGDYNILSGTEGVEQVSFTFGVFSNAYAFTAA
jgi:hypothetical protein